MSDKDKNRPVIQRNEHGEFVLTNYGEFLSYYHAHQQAFKKMIGEKGLSPTNADNLLKTLKNFMVINIKKITDFAEHANTLAHMLEMSTVDYNSYMSDNFLGILSKVQQKLLDQEVQNRKSMNDSNYSQITEEIVEVVGAIIPPGTRFIVRDDLLVLEDMRTGKITEPKGLLSEIKDEQKKEAERLEKRFAPKTKILPQYEIEKSFLIEITSTLKNRPPVKDLNLNRFDPEIEVRAEVIIPKPEKPKQILEDIPDLDFDEDANSEDYDEDIETDSYSEPEEEMPSNGITSIDLDDILSNVPGGMDPEPEPEVEEPDEVDELTFQNYSDIVKIIQNFRQAGDNKGYSDWMNSLSFRDKCIVSLRSSITSEGNGDFIDWKKVIQMLSDKSKLAVPLLVKLRNKIKHFDFLRIQLDNTVKEFKNLQPEALNMAKNGWPHILKSFQAAPDYDSIESDISNLLIKIKSESIRQPIQGILNKGFQKLRENLNITKNAGL